MKKVLFTLAIAVGTLQLKAQQIKPENALPYNLLTEKSVELKVDTTIKLMLAKPLTYAEALTYVRNNPSTSKITLAQPRFDAIVYSRMPVKKLYSADKMPVATNLGAIQPNTPVKRIDIVDPLADATN
jgi:hypothetical protein